MSILKRIIHFSSSYLEYVNGIRLTALVAQWIGGFMDEILKSKVNQISIVLAVIGIAGALSAGYTYVVEHPIVVLIALACGAVLFVGLTMYDFALRQRMTINEEDANDVTLERMLSILINARSKTKNELKTSLGNMQSGFPDALKKGLAEGWVEYSSGALRIPEAMKPIVRHRLRTKSKKEE